MCWRAENRASCRGCSVKMESWQEKPCQHTLNCLKPSAERDAGLIVSGISAMERKQKWRQNYIETALETNFLRRERHPIKMRWPVFVFQWIIIHFYSRIKLYSRIIWNTQKCWKDSMKNTEIIAAQLFSWYKITSLPISLQEHNPNNAIYRTSFYS